jgi:hypothetical protein
LVKGLSGETLACLSIKARRIETLDRQHRRPLRPFCHRQRRP